MVKKISTIILIFLAIILVIGVTLYKNTGFLQYKDIDTKDLATFQFDAEGVRIGGQGLQFNGSKTCWILIHGYSSTPDELKQVGMAINQKFNDTVYIPRLKGHAMVSSDLERHTINEWYTQIETIAQYHNCTYILGSSMGASLALKYTEMHTPTGTILSGFPTELEPTYMPGWLIEYFIYPLGDYLKKSEPYGTIDDRNAKINHLSINNFPLKGVVGLIHFTKDLKADLQNIHTPVLFIHAKNDQVATLAGAKKTFDLLNTSKNFITLEYGNHILFEDYNKEQAINAVLVFRENNKPQ